MKLLSPWLFGLLAALAGGGVGWVAHDRAAPSWSPIGGTLLLDRRSGQVVNWATKATIFRPEWCKGEAADFSDLLTDTYPPGREP